MGNELLHPTWPFYYFFFTKFDIGNSIRKFKAYPNKTFKERTREGGGDKR